MSKYSSRLKRLLPRFSVFFLLVWTAAPAGLPGLIHPTASASAAVRRAAAVQTAAKRKIAFTFGGSNNTTTEIFVVNEDGTGQQRLTNNGIEDREPTWSPDGSQIAFASNRGGTYNIFRMNADGTGQVPVTNSTQGSNNDPAWSPDAQRLAFVSNRGGAGRLEVWVIGADGTNPQRLTVNRELTSDSFGPVYSQDREPAWSPDGTKIAFSSNRDGLGNFDIYVMNADGSNPLRLTSSPGDDGNPAWSPDGTKIAFSSTRGGNPEIYVMNADGSGQTDLTNTATANEIQPSWSQDGTSIAYVRLSNQQSDGAMILYMMAPDGSNQTPVVNNAPSDSWMPAWQTLGGPVPPPAPRAPGYRVTGRVLDYSRNPSGIGLAGIVMQLSGAQSATTQTDANGVYSFEDLAANSTYTVRPATTSYGYVPASQTFTTGPPENSAGSGGTITKDFTASPITLQFGASGDTAAENSGPRGVTIERNGFITGESSVDYAVVGGTATAGSDFTAVSGTLHFAPGQSTNSIVIPVLDDAADEPDETVILKLSNPSGALLGARDTFVLTIQDNDPPPSQIDDSQFFVRQHYLDFLNREPDPEGLQFWTQGIEVCGSDAGCREVKRIDTSAAFFLSIEFRETGYLVYRAYKVAYGDATSPNVPGTVPVIRFSEFLPDTQAIGQGVVVNSQGWEQQLETNKRNYFNSLVARSRFVAAYPTSRTPAEFVDALYANAGVTPSAEERQAAVNEFGGAADTSDDAARARALRRVAENTTLAVREFNRAFVLMQYYGYLRRNPDDAPDADFRGWRFWLDKLEQFGGDFRRAEMVKAFLDSIEYRRRFAQ